MPSSSSEDQNSSNKSTASIDHVRSVSRNSCRYCDRESPEGRERRREEGNRDTNPIENRGGQEITISDINFNETVVALKNDYNKGIADEKQRRDADDNKNHTHTPAWEAATTAWEARAQDSHNLTVKTATPRRNSGNSGSGDSLLHR